MPLFIKQSRLLSVVVVVLMLSLFSSSQLSSAENVPSSDNEPSCNTGKMITAEELASKNGKNGAEIWLGIMGEVYDVSDGEEYYGDGGGYSFFAGRDASVTFVSGQFNEEGLKKKFDELEANEIRSIESWRMFYSQHEKYKYKGLLVGELYDSEGASTPVMNRMKEKLKA